MYREYANGTHRNYNGARLGAVAKSSPFELAETQDKANPDGLYWETRAVQARIDMMVDATIDDALFNDFNDRMNLVANGLPWKRLYEIWTRAHKATKANPSISLVDLVREAGLDLA